MDVSDGRRVRLRRNPPHRHESFQFFLWGGSRRKRTRRIGSQEIDEQAIQQSWERETAVVERLETAEVGPILLG
jgi:hypothetical protein